MRLGTKSIAAALTSPSGVIFVAGFLWSFSGILIKLLNCNAFVIAGGRAAIAVVVQLFYLQYTGTKLRAPKSRLEWLAIVAFVCNILLLVFAFQLTSAANAVFLHYSGVVLVAFFAPRLLGEKTTKHDWLAVLLVMVGIYLLAGTQFDARTMLGNFLGVLCGITLAIMNLCWRQIGKTGEHVDVINSFIISDIFTFLISSVAVIFFVPAHNLGLGPDWLQNSVLFIALGIIPWALPNILFCRVIGEIPIVRSIIVGALDPILTAVWPMLILAEFPTAWGYLGCVLILAAIVISQYAEMKNPQISIAVPESPEEDFVEV